MGKLLAYREVKFRERPRTYSVELSQESVVIGTDSPSASLSATATAFCRKGNSGKSTYEAYWFIYSRVGNTFSLLRNYTSEKRSSISISETVTTSIDAIVVFVADTPVGFDPTNANTYVVKGEVSVRKQGDTGPQGDGGYSVQVSRSVIPILTSGDGVVKDFTSKAVSFSLMKGGQSQSLQASNIVIGTLPLGMVATKNGNTVTLNYNNSVGVWKHGDSRVYTTTKYPNTNVDDAVYDGTGAKIDEVDSSGTVYIRVNGLQYTGEGETFPYLTDSIVVPITITKGTVRIDTGITLSPNREGKMNRNFFYLGQWDNWNAVPASTEFKVTKWETPYLALANGANGSLQYYVYVGDAEGTLTKSQVGNPAEMNNGNWEGMVTSHKFLIAQAFFTQWAKLGGWYFNGNYMFSDLGEDSNGGSTSFSAGGRFYGDGDSRNTYTPNLYLDANTGKVFSNIGHFRNVVVEGVINNLIQEINSNNYQNYGRKCNLAIVTQNTEKTLVLDPTKVGSVIMINTNFGDSEYINQLMLPCAYNALYDDTYMPFIFDYGLGLTIDEMRQCVGKVLYILPSYIQSQSFRILCGGYKEYNYQSMLIASLYNGQPQPDDYAPLTGSRVKQKIDSYTAENTGMYFYKLECKMSVFNAKECIYWELEEFATTMTDVLNYTDY